MTWKHKATGISHAGFEFCLIKKLLLTLPMSVLEFYNSLMLCFFSRICLTFSKMIVLRSCLRIRISRWMSRVKNLGCLTHLFLK